MHVPAHLVKIASVSHIWESLVLSKSTTHEASRRMHVSLSDAEAGLRYAAAALREREQNCLDAQTVLTGSGAVKQDVPAREWDEVALGLRRI